MIFQTHCPNSFSISAQSGAILIGVGGDVINRSMDYYKWDFESYREFITSKVGIPAIVKEKAIERLKWFFDKFPSSEIYTKELKSIGWEKMREGFYYQYSKY